MGLVWLCCTVAWMANASMAGQLVVVQAIGDGDGRLATLASRRWQLRGRGGYGLGTLTGSPQPYILTRPNRSGLLEPP